MHSGSNIATITFQKPGLTLSSPFSISTITGKCKKRQCSINYSLILLLTFIFFPVTICFHLSDLGEANRMLSMMQMWFCGWCLLDIGIVCLVTNSFLQGHTQTLSLCLTSLKDTDKFQPPRLQTAKQKIQWMKTSVTRHNNNFLNKVTPCEESTNSLAVNNISFEIRSVLNSQICYL